MSDYTPTTKRVLESYIYGERYKYDKVFPARHPARIKEYENEFARFIANKKADECERIIGLLQNEIDRLIIARDVDPEYVSGISACIALIKGEQK